MKKKSLVGWVHSLNEVEFCEDEEGAIYLTIAIYKHKKALAERMGNEWCKLSKKVRITIEEI